MTYWEWKQLYPNDIIMIKEPSTIHVTFYNAYDHDAEVIHDATGYRTYNDRENHIKCGGPNYELICQKLKFRNISYRVVTPSQELASWQAEEATCKMNIIIDDYPQRVSSVLKFLNDNNIPWTENKIKETCEEEATIQRPDNSIEENQPILCEYRKADNGHVIQIGDKVSLINENTGEILDIVIEQTIFGVEYTHEGGPYGSVGTRVTESSNAGKMLDDGTVIVSSESPLGELAIGKKRKQYVKFTGPTGEMFSYKIYNIFVK